MSGNFQIDIKLRINQICPSKIFHKYVIFCITINVFFSCVKLLIYSAISVVKNQFNCTFKFFLSFFWINFEPGIRIFKSKNTNQNNFNEKNHNFMSVGSRSFRSGTNTGYDPGNTMEIGKSQPDKSI